MSRSAGRTLAALAFLVAAPPLLAGFPGTDVFIPASARAAGVSPAQFYSTLWVTNPGAAPANVTLRFLQRDTANTSPVTVAATIAPGETRKYENVVETLFGLSGTSGAIRLQSDQEVLASSRTYNLPPGSDIRDASGLYFGAIPRSLAIGFGESAQLQGVSQGGAEDYRYNFGLVEVTGAPVIVRVIVRAADGSVLGSKDYPALQPFEAKQFAVTDVVPGIATANGRIEAAVIAGGGRVLLYGTGVANGSQDSIGYEMSFPSSILAPGGVSSLNGFTGAVTLTAGTGIGLSASGGNGFTISATGAGGLALPFSGSASTSGGTGAFTLGNTGSGPAIVATALGASAVIASVPGTATGDHALYGVVTSSSPASNTAAVRGQNNGTGPNGIGVHGSQAGSGWGVLGAAPIGIGVRGQQGAESGVTPSAGKAGVWGDSTDSYGVFGSSANSAGVTGASTTRYGVQALGFALGENGAALGAFAGTAGGTAGYFSGSVRVAGNLSKAGGSFRIDHPLDPENKVLSHSFVESPDMKNIYDGVVVLDSKGEALVLLPEWFTALNRDFRYQLTCVGGYAPVYVSREVDGNAFAIAGGRPGLKVSWQLTGIRQDAWANAHRIVVEEAKPREERGTYLHPELFGQPEEKSLDWARNPEIMKELRAQRQRLAAEAARRAGESERGPAGQR